MKVLNQVKSVLNFKKVFYFFFVNLFPFILKIIRFVAFPFRIQIFWFALMWNKPNFFFGEIETEFENTLACLSGAWMGSNHEKNGGQKSRYTLPLNA